ncbi:MAG: FG-GAP repeat protein [Planctomycetes bacterium]|nr:FG-GAP repeat protein [Planctomycetota bacterium]
MSEFTRAMRVRDVDMVLLKHLGTVAALAVLWQLLTPASQVLAQCQRTKLTADDGAPGDWFGYSVAVSGDVAVVGAMYRDMAGHNYGAGYVFQRSGSAWSQVAMLYPPGYGGLVGRSVGIDGHLIVMGGQAWSTGVYERVEGVWTYAAEIAPDEYELPTLFGIAVDVSGETILVGDPEYDGTGANSGAAYVFERDPNGVWPQVEILVPEGGASGAEFGHSVAIDGDTAVVGAWTDSDLGSYSGSAYIFERDRNGVWAQAGKLLADDGSSFDFFGSDVAICGDIALVGAPDANGAAANTGAAYVFQRDLGGRWSQTGKLWADDGASWDGFGRSVDLSGNVAVIGANGVDDLGNRSGAAYVFVCNHGQWFQVAKLLADDGAASDALGNSVAVSANTAVVGAYKDDDHGEDSGSAYVFAVGPDEDGDGIMDVCLCPGDLDGDLDVDLSDLAQLLSNYGATSGAGYEDGDLDEDGDVDLADLAALLAVYGTECP